MRNFKILGFLCIAAILSLHNVADAAPIFGRYTGIIRHESIKRDQLAKLDLITSREDGNTLLLKAVLTLHFGDFASGEYVAYHFDDVRFNLTTQTFVFDQADQPITLVGKQSGKQFIGEFRSAYSGEIGKVILNSDKPAEPSLPLVEPIWGEYQGKCQKKTAPGMVDTLVQLYTYRSNEGATTVGNPFRAYKIKGTIAHENRNDCLESSTKFCVWGNLNSGSYNFFKNRLVLFGNYRNLSCSVEPNGLRCNDCELLTRVSDETKSPRTLSPLSSKAGFEESKKDGDPALQGDVTSIQGEYRGYVHHEYLNRYQLGGMNILTYQASSGGTPSTLRMSAIGTLYFGDDANTESISYRFKERSYPSPLTVPQFVFSQAEADVDALVQVTYLGKGVIRGVWYSQLFGRVGTFEFYKDGLPKLPSGAKLMEPVGGHYEGTRWEVDLMVGMGVSAPNTENPFSPLTMGGWTLLDHGEAIPRMHFTGGSYDFYTGKIGFEVGEKGVQLGQRVSRQRLRLKWTYGAFLTPLQDHQLTPYRLTGEAER